MFSSTFAGGTDLRSSWKAERPHKDSESQTGALDVKEAEVQSIDRSSVEIQTRNPSTEELKLAPYDEKNLAAFLKRVTPPLLRELDKNRRSHAFEGYDLISEESTELLTKIHNLSCPSFVEKMFRCSDITWNSTGSVIAACYGFPDHEDWCDHHGGVCVWNLNRKDFNPTQPNKTIEYSCCITCLKFHPERPAIIVAGNFIGEVLLWDLSADDDMLVATTEMGSRGHHDTVTHVEWTVNPSSKNSEYQIVSCGLDGKILIWQFNGQKLELRNAFVLLADNLPRSIRLRSNRLNSEVGVTTLSFNAEDPSVFVIGSEGGGIFQCSTYSQFPAQAETDFSIPLKNPVSLTYNPHKGQVSGVNCNPFTRNLFLTCGSDGEIRIYNLNQAHKPQRTLHSDTQALTKAQWSPVKPLLIAAVTSGGYLNIYDLRSTTSGAVAAVKMGETNSSGWVIEFNKKSPRLLASGSADGSIQIWSLSDKLIVPGNQELECVQLMGKVT